MYHFAFDRCRACSPSLKQFNHIEQFLQERYEAVFLQLYLYHCVLASLHTTDDHFHKFNAENFQGDTAIIGD